jgi:hypothetical protein
MRFELLEDLPLRRKVQVLIEAAGLFGTRFHRYLPHDPCRWNRIDLRPRFG